jgi:hypothetical protein
VLARCAQEIAEALMSLPHVHVLDSIAAEEIGTVVALLESVHADLERRGRSGPSGGHGRGGKFRRPLNGLPHADWGKGLPLASPPERLKGTSSWRAVHKLFSLIVVGCVATQGVVAQAAPRPQRTIPCREIITTFPRLGSSNPRGSFKLLLEPDITLSAATKASSR